MILLLPPAAMLALAFAASDSSAHRRWRDANWFAIGFCALVAAMALAVLISSPAQARQSVFDNHGPVRCDDRFAATCDTRGWRERKRHLAPKKSSSGAAPWDADAPRRPSHEFRRMWSDSAAVRKPYRTHYAVRWKASRLAAVSHRSTQTNAPRIAAAAVDGASRGSIRAAYASNQVVEHPAGCPRNIPFCGCGAAVRIFGAPIRALWLAANWFKFPRAAPAPGMAAVRPHHVFVIERVLGNGLVVAYDANSGGRKTRIHVRSLAGFRVVNPHG